jgi:hypothetical protein
MRLIYCSDVLDGIVTYKFAAFASQEDNDIRVPYVQDLFRSRGVLTSHLYSLGRIHIPIRHRMEAQELQPAVHLLVWEC